MGGHGSQHNKAEALKRHRASFLASFLLSFLASSLLSTLSYPPFSLSLGPRADSSQTRLPCLGLGELCVWPLLGPIMVAESFFQIITTDKERWLMGTSDCGGRRGQRVSGIGLIVTNNLPHFFTLAAREWLLWAHLKGKPFMSDLCGDHFEVLRSVPQEAFSLTVKAGIVQLLWPPLGFLLLQPESREIFHRCDTVDVKLCSHKLFIFIKRLHFAMCALILCRCPGLLSQEFDSCSQAKPSTFLSQSCFPAFYTALIPYFSLIVPRCDHE